MYKIKWAIHISFEFNNTKYEELVEIWLAPIDKEIINIGNIPFNRPTV